MKEIILISICGLIMLFTVFLSVIFLSNVTKHKKRILYKENSIHCEPFVLLSELQNQHHKSVVSEDDMKFDNYGPVHYDKIKIKINRKKCDFGKNVVSIDDLKF